VGYGAGGFEAFGDGQAGSEVLEECGFAGTGGAHDGEEVTGTGDAGQSVNQEGAG
jgi:hypothetical protein